MLGKRLRGYRNKPLKRVKGVLHAELIPVL